MRRKIATFVALLMSAFGISALSSTPASANSGWMSNAAYMSVGGGNHEAYVEAWFSAWECGLEMCASTGWLDAIMDTYSGTYGNLNRVKEGTSFSGTGLSISVSSGGIGAGFTQQNSGCYANAYSYGLSYSGWAESYTGDWVCDANTWGWISTAYANNTGGVRYSSTWYNKPVTASAGTNIQ